MRIHMDWHDSAVYVTDMTTCVNTVLGKAATAKKWEWTDQAAALLKVGNIMLLQERVARPTAQRRVIPDESKLGKQPLSTRTKRERGAEVGSPLLSQHKMAKQWVRLTPRRSS